MRGGAGELRKHTSIVYQRGGFWLPGIVQQAWSNKSVTVSLNGDAGELTGSVALTLPAHVVFPLHTPTDGYFGLQAGGGRPEYSNLMDAYGELPFLPAAPGCGVLLRGLAVCVGGRGNGTVGALRADGLASVEFEDGATELHNSKIIQPGRGDFGAAPGGEDDGADGGGMMSAMVGEVGAEWLLDELDWD